MTEPEKTKIQVRKPAGYLEVPIETSDNGLAKDEIPKFAKSEAELVTYAGPRGKPMSEYLKPTSDNPAKDPSGDLIEAVRTVFRVVTARIAHHEKEAQRLREALAPFANHARQSAAPQPQSDGATVEALLRIADELNKGD